MAKAIRWESNIGRRIRLRDLHVFHAVVQAGSLSRAAAQLGVSQPTVSNAIADLEHMVGFRLFERSSRGVEPTVYGAALIKRSVAAFDQLKQGIRDMEFLSDPTTGEIRIGCPESIAASILPPALGQFAQHYPRALVHVEQVGTRTLEIPQLRARTLDLVIARLVDNVREEDLNVELLFNDTLVLVVGRNSRWARRRKIDLVELISEPWILAAPGTWNNSVVEEAFRARSLEMPKSCVSTLSINIRINMLASGRFIATLPKSVLTFNVNRESLVVLNVEIPVRPWPVALVTVRNRTLSPIVERFTEHFREFIKSSI